MQEREESDKQTAITYVGQGFREGVEFQNALMETFSIVDTPSNDFLGLFREWRLPSFSMFKVHAAVYMTATHPRKL